MRKSAMAWPSLRLLSNGFEQHVHVYIYMYVHVIMHICDLTYVCIVCLVKGGTHVP